MNITEPQSHAALDRLLRSGKVNEEDVSFALAEARTDIEMRLAHLRRFDSVVASDISEPISFILGPNVTATVTPAARRAKKRHMSAAQTISRKVQGVYLSLIRHTPKSKRGKYQAIAKAKGREVAIAAMKQARG